MERPSSSKHKACTRAAALLLALGLCAAQPAMAVVVPNLYTVTVTPDPTADDPRSAAVEAAMRELLARVTGRRDAGFDPELQEMVQGASSYVSSYAEVDRPARAIVGFLANEVDRELAARNHPIWPPERPLTLVWVAIDGGQGERTLLGSDGAAPGLSPEMQALTESIRTGLLEVAEQRGLPITLPLLDLEDLGSVGFADVWGGFAQSVLAASARYRADAVLVGRVRATEFGNDVQWTLLRDTQRRLMAGTVVEEGLQWLADVYARDFGVLGGVRTMRVLVRDVSSLADYGRVMSYLEDLSALERVDVESLADGVLSLRVAARGDLEVMERTFSLGRVVRLADGLDSPNALGDAPNTMVLEVARFGRTP